MKEKKFVCGYCGSGYNILTDRIKCELKCDDERITKEERLRKEVLSKERDGRKQEIYITQRAANLIYKRLDTLKQQYLKDYGTKINFIREVAVENVDFNGDWEKYLKVVFDSIVYNKKKNDGN